MIVVRPLDGAAIEGQPATLRCQGQAQDRPRSFWYKVTTEGQEVLLPGGDTNIRVNNGVLQFLVSQDSKIFKVRCSEISKSHAGCME